MLVDPSELLSRLREFATGNPVAASVAGGWIYDALRRVASALWGQPADANLFDLLWCRAVYRVGETEFPHLLDRVASIRGAFAEGQVADTEQLQGLLSGVGVDPDAASRILDALQTELQEVLLRAARSDARAFMPAVVDELVALGWVQRDLVNAVAPMAQDVADTKEMVREIRDGGPPAPPPGEALPPPFEVPQDLRHFVGRTGHVATMERALMGEGAVLCVCALHGMGGVGKSALAAHVAHRLHGEGHFPDGVLWADLAARSAAECAAGFIRAYGYTDDQVPEHPEECLTRYRSVLHGKRALLVLDNAQDEEVVVSLLPGSPAVAVVVTTRRALTAAGNFVPQPVELDTFLPDEAAELLRAYVGARAEAEPEAITTICKLVGYLPLAVDIAGCRLADAGRSSRLAPFVEQLREERTLLDQLKIGDRAERDVRAVLAVSYNMLEGSQKELFAHLSLIGAGSFGSSAVVAMLGVAKQSALDGLDDLVDLSLCRRSVDGGFVLHDLVRVFATEKLKGEFPAEAARTATERLAEYEEACHQAALTGARAGRLGRERQWEEAEATWGEVRRINEELGHRGGLAQALGGLAAAYAQQGQTAKAVVAYEKAQALNLELGDRVGEAKAWGGLAAAYAQQGQTAEAVEANERALPISVALGDRVGEAKAWGGLAAAYARQGQVEKAVEAYEKDMALCLELGDRVGEAQAWGGLAAAYAQQGQMAKAVEAYEKAQALNLELKDRVGEAKAWGGLAAAYAQQGQTAKAIEAYEKALVIQEELNDRPHLAQTWGGLAAAYAQQGQTAKAVEAYEKAQALNLELKDRAGEAKAWGGLAAAYAQQGQTAKAVEAYEKAQALNLELKDRVGEAKAWGGLASVYARQGEAEKAVEAYGKAQALNLKLGDRVGQAKAWGGLGGVLLRAKRPREAAEHLERAVAIERDMGHRRHLPMTLYNLARAYEADGQVEVAVGRAREGLKIAQGRARENLERFLRRHGVTGG